MAPLSLLPLTTLLLKVKYTLCLPSDAVAPPPPLSSVEEADDDAGGMWR